MQNPFPLGSRERGQNFYKEIRPFLKGFFKENPRCRLDPKMFGKYAMQAALWNLPPTALTTTLTTNIINPMTTTGGTPASASPYGNTRIVLTRIHIANKHASVAATFSLWKGASAGNVAGTELALGIAVAVGGEYNMDFPRGLVFDVADFLVGGSNTATALTITAYGEITITK